MTTTETPAALPATITFSNSNLRDYIRARGKDVPLLINASSLKEFIKEQAAKWQFHLVSVPKKLFENCKRAAEIASTQALDAYIKEKFPTPIELIAGSGELVDMEIPETLPRYTVENAVKVVTLAANTVVIPWVLSGAHHTNPNRQAAGVAASSARKGAGEVSLCSQDNPVPDAENAEPDAIVEEGTTMQQFETGEPTIHDQKTAAAVELANSEFESSVDEDVRGGLLAISRDNADVPFSGAGYLKQAGITPIKNADVPVIIQEMTGAPAVDTLESWLNEHGLRTMELDGCEQPWICMVAGVTDDSIASKMGMRVALQQGLVVQGMTELHACFNYSAKHKLPWPDSLSLALEQQAIG